MYRKDAAGKPLFSPKYTDPAEAKQAILLVVRRSPQQFGYQRSRWRMDMLAETCPWLRVSQPASLSSLLKRLGISYKRGRDYVHSPDRNYMNKLSAIELARLRAFYNPDDFTLIYIDELSYYRQPTVAQAYERRGKLQPLAQRSHRSNTCFRIIGGLNCVTGQVTFRQRSHITRTVISDFWGQLRQDYPKAKTIYAVVDNWPVHYHPDTLASLKPQNFPFPPRVPDNWPKKSSKKVKLTNLPIELLPLPTYASWLNPIEKLWRWLKQDVIHLHRHSDNWPQLKTEVATFLEQFSDGSDELLRYVGLLPI
ncbi:MAG: IS630 family transposase [Chloroflexota bacterium]